MSLRMRMIGCRLAKIWRWRGKCASRGRKTWGGCVNDDMKMHGLQPEWAIFRDMLRVLIWSKRLTLA